MPAPTHRPPVPRRTLLRAALDEHDAGVARIEAAMREQMAASGWKGSFEDFLKFLKSDRQFFAKTPDELMGVAAYVAKRADGTPLPGLVWFACEQATYTCLPGGRTAADGTFTGWALPSTRYDVTVLSATDDLQDATVQVQLLVWLFVMRILMIAPEPFFEPRGTPFSEYHRIKALLALGHTNSEIAEKLFLSRRTVETHRANLFANTPDILHDYLQTGGRPAFQIRLDVWSRSSRMNSPDSRPCSWMTSSASRSTRSPSATSATRASRRWVSRES